MSLAASGMDAKSAVLMAFVFGLRSASSTSASIWFIRRCHWSSSADDILSTVITFMHRCVHRFSPVRFTACGLPVKTHARDRHWTRIRPVLSLTSYKPLILRERSQCRPRSAKPLFVGSIPGLQFFENFHPANFISRSACPAPLRSGSLISEYLRESSTPGAPARRAAITASLTLCGVHLL